MASLWPHKFPKSYKQYKVLQGMMLGGGLTYTEIIKLAFELDGSVFDKVGNRGYWSGAFKQKSHYPWANDLEGWITKLCFIDTINGLCTPVYKPTTAGLAVFYKLKQQFGDLTPEEAMKQHKDKLEAHENKKEFKKGMKSVPISILTGMPINVTSSIETVQNKEKLDNPVVSNDNTTVLRGLRLDDKVAYYRKYNGESGEGYVQSVTMYSNKLSNLNEISIGGDNGTITGITHDVTQDIFFEKGLNEIEIIKVS